MKELSGGGEGVEWGNSEDGVHGAGKLRDVKPRGRLKPSWKGNYDSIRFARGRKGGKERIEAKSKAGVTESSAIREPGEKLAEEKRRRLARHILDRTKYYFPSNCTGESSRSAGITNGGATEARSFRENK